MIKKYGGYYNENNDFIIDYNDESGKENKKESFLDINGFRKMFKSTKQNLLEDQTIDFNNMLVVTSLLEKINAKLIKS